MTTIKKKKLYTRALSEFSNPQALNAASGIAFHWYSGNHFENISLCRKLFQTNSYFTLKDALALLQIILFPNQYAHDITEDLNHGVNGYIDWNILLDNKGGPNHKKKNYCNSPVMLNDTNSDYIKSLSYYYIGHFSKIIHPGARRIAFSKYIADITMTALKKP